MAQGFGPNHHLGEDWNGTGGGNSDKGDPVHAIGAGIVTVSRDAGSGWGNVVRVKHRVTKAGKEVEFESLYAHLDRIDVAIDEVVSLAQPLGTIGDAHGRYIAHLHLEVRSVVGLPLGPGYSSQTAGYQDPRAWIAAHQAGCVK